MSNVYTFSNLLLELFICYIFHGIIYMIVPFIVSKTANNLSPKSIKYIIIANGIIIFFVLVFLHYSISFTMPSWIATIIWSCIANKLLKRKISS